MYFIEDASKADGMTFVHQTSSIENAENIIRNGFDLSRTDETAKRYGAPPSLFKHDPHGMYAFNQNAPRDPDTPVVAFKLLNSARVLWHDMEGGDIKRQLFSDLNATSREELSHKLQLLGVDAIANVNNDSELIILNFNAIELTGFGFDRDVKPLSTTAHAPPEPHNETSAVNQKLDRSLVRRP